MGASAGQETNVPCESNSSRSAEPCRHGEGQGLGPVNCPKPSNPKPLKALNPKDWESGYVLF